MIAWLIVLGLFIVVMGIATLIVELIEHLPYQWGLLILYSPVLLMLAFLVHEMVEAFLKVRVP